MSNRCLQKNTMAEAKRIFIQEVQDRLPEAQSSLEIILHRGFEQEACTSLYKFAHTLKGSGRTLGVWDIAEPAGEMEVTIDLVLNHGVDLGKGIKSFLSQRMEDILESTVDINSRGSQNYQISKSHFGRKKVLVVDDDLAITDLLKKTLVEKGFVVTICHNTLEAEQYLELEQPDIIVLDIILPTSDGIEFCRRMRSNSQWKLVPIIFLTIKGRLQDKLAGFATGADDYLCKPIEVEELVARINAILNRIEVSEDLIFQDDLTRAFNRRYLLRYLEKEIIHSKYENKEFFLAMVDIDNFKEANDNFGHAVGDEVLQTLIKRIQDDLRETDVICRYGGEEFIIILPNTSQAIADVVLERLRKKIAIEPLILPKNGQKLNITVSIGVSSFPHDGRKTEDLIKAADKAMYNAKGAGRNMVVFSKEVMGDDRVKEDSYY